ncbi:hypothetical protein H9639_06000 [Arthrobacter sp. Sa2CUA1]|uniref:Uncharacterized protein n=1 Tax=Arthrobacter gallicola TaxID=2762225 RepID=A0ABR8UQL0_9MICC|nr:hypothetical protein [Arthrobacter gallicola]MBD7994849.1 hypothetical protein [Arthrobacter gallicola]
MQTARCTLADPSRYAPHGPKIGRTPTMSTACLSASSLLAFRALSAGPWGPALALALALAPALALALALAKGTRHRATGSPDRRR